MNYIDVKQIKSNFEILIVKYYLANISNIGCVIEKPGAI
jgi:hypothetical protein